MTDFTISDTWRKLSKQQLGTYAEYFVKMQFTLHGFSVYSPEIDDRSIDFVVTAPNVERFYQVQVKSIRGPGYAFVQKRKFALSELRLVALAVFHGPETPDLYLIPSTVWNTPDKCFVSRDFGPGRKSEPEWGIEATKRHLEQTLGPYRFDHQVRKLHAV
jgi:hypothetical protein